MNDLEKEILMKYANSLMKKKTSEKICGLWLIKNSTILFAFESLTSYSSTKSGLDFQKILGVHTILKLPGVIKF